LKTNVCGCVDGIYHLFPVFFSSFLVCFFASLVGGYLSV